MWANISIISFLSSLKNSWTVKTKCEKKDFLQVTLCPCVSNALGEKKNQSKQVKLNFHYKQRANKHYTRILIQGNFIIIKIHTRIEASQWESILIYMLWPCGCELHSPLLSSIDFCLSSFETLLLWVSEWARVGSTTLYCNGECFVTHRLTQTLNYVCSCQFNILFPDILKYWQSSISKLKLKFFLEMNVLLWICAWRKLYMFVVYCLRV